MSNKNSTKPSNRNNKPSRNRTNNTPSTKNSKQGSKNVTLADTLPNRGRNNDPNWYFTNAELANQAGQLSFQSFMGTGAVIGNKSISAPPAIISILVNPCPGTTYNVNPARDLTQTHAYNILPRPADYLGDPYATGINIAGFKIYNMLATHSGRVSNYAPQDVTAMILGIAALAETSEHIRRVFGVSMMTNARNRSLPRDLVKAMGVDYDDLLKNSAAYRMRFNTEIARINQIPLLGNVAFIAKARDIFQHIYVDSASSMSTIFFYAPNSSWYLDENTYEEGIVLRTIDLKQLRGTAQPMSDLLNVMSAQITALLNSTTLNLIYADLINLASKVSIPMWSFDYLAENYAILPEYNRNAMLQLHNATIVGRPDPAVDDIIKDGSFIITPNNDVYPVLERNALVYNPAIILPHGKWNETEFYAADDFIHRLVDFDTESPDLVDKIEATRFMATYSGYRYRPEGEQFSDAICVNLPDHYITRMRVWNGDSTIDALESSFTNESAPVYHWAAYFSNVDMAPFIYAFSGTDLDREYNQGPNAVFGSLNYFTKIDGEWLTRVNRLMNTGLFEFRV